MIREPFATAIHTPQAEIERWKSQIREGSRA